MRIALLVRGFHFLRKDRFGFPMDGRRCAPSLLRNILEPLRREHEVDLFFATYPSPILDELQGMLSPKACVLPEVKTSTQVSTFLDGLEMVEHQGTDYDRIISTRFDLTYLKLIDSWNIWHASPGIYFPWREYEAGWVSRKTVGDAVHVIDTRCLELFREGLGLLPRKHDLHQLYAVLAPLTANLHFMEPDFYDSNTLYWNRECRNPLYRISNRPRLPISQPYLITANPELLSWSQKFHWKVATALLRPTAWMAQATSRLPQE